MEPIGWVFLGFMMLIFVGPIVLFVLWQFRRQDRFMNQLADIIGAPKLSFFSSPNRIKGTIDGTPCECTYAQRVRWGPSVLGIKVPMRFPGRACIVPALPDRSSLKGKLAPSEFALEAVYPLLDRVSGSDVRARAFAERILADQQLCCEISGMFGNRIFDGSMLTLDPTFAELALADPGPTIDPSIFTRFAALAMKLSDQAGAGQSLAAI